MTEVHHEAIISIHSEVLAMPLTLYTPFLYPPNALTQSASLYRMHESQEAFILAFRYTLKVEVSYNRTIVVDSVDLSYIFVRRRGTFKLLISQPRPFFAASLVLHRSLPMFLS